MKIEWKWYWRENEQGEADCGVFWEKRPGMCYSICRAPRYEKKEMWEMNAPLLSSAPNLLEDLKAIIALTDRDHELWDKAKADIAKAEGKENEDVR